MKEVAICDALSADSEHHKVGEMLPEEQRMFRLSAVESFLSAGIPLQKVNHLRDLLEINGSALSELMPTVRMMEMKRLRADLPLPEPGARNDHCCN